MAFKLQKGMEVGREFQGKEMIVGGGTIIADMKSLCHTLISKPVVTVCILLVAIPLIY